MKTVKALALTALVITAMTGQANAKQAAINSACSGVSNGFVDTFNGVAYCINTSGQAARL